MLGSSFLGAKNHFLILERRLSRNSEPKAMYRNFIHEYINLGHAKVIPFPNISDLSNSNYFFPHHPILKESSTSCQLNLVQCLL